jgi:hypothetical protein
MLSVAGRTALFEALEGPGVPLLRHRLAKSNDRTRQEKGT